MTEVHKLEDFLRDTGAEAIALGAVSLQCRRIKEVRRHSALHPTRRDRGPDR